CADLVPPGRDVRTFGDDRQVTALRGSADVREQGNGPPQEIEPAEPPESGVRVREVLTDVPQPRGTKERVSERVADDVAVGVAREPGLVVEPDATQDERPVRVPRVQIDPEADPKVAHRSAGASPRRATISSARRRSSGVVILKLPGSPATVAIGMPLASSRSASSVASSTSSASCAARRLAQTK